MDKTIIYQFTDADAVEISSDNHPSCGELVNMIQRAGSMHFQFSMTPDQARQMASALIAHADFFNPTPSTAQE